MVALAVLAAFVSTADAATQRLFKEEFGPAEKPSFSWARIVAVDPGTNDVLIADYDKKVIRRFHADGTPAPFSALGGNAIDGQEANGKPCVEEPASCDMTPQNGLEIVGEEAQQITVDNSGGPTDGNIYLTQPGSSTGPTLVDIFGSDGKYLGQLTAAGTVNYQGLGCGVAVDSTGVVYTAIGGDVLKYVPTSNVPVNSDYVSTFLPGFGLEVCNIAMGSGASAGSLFGTGGTGTGDRFAFKFDKETGELEYTFAAESLAAPLAVDPATGRVFIRTGNDELSEFDASGDSAVRVGRVLGAPGHPIRYGFAVSPSGDEVYAASNIGEPISVFGAPGIIPTVTTDAASEVTGSKALLTGAVDPEGVEVTKCFFEYGENKNVGENTVPCEGAIPTDSAPHAVRAKLANLLPNGHTYGYRLVAENANGREETPIQTFITSGTVVTEAPNPVGTTTATLRGAVRPEGSEYSACVFEYGLASSDSPEKTVPCTPSAAAIEPDLVPHQVSAAISGLQAGVSYRFVLVATNAEGTLKGEEVTFTTLGKPQIGEIRARNADQSSVTIEAKVNPSGFGTSYHFEWGPTDAYGNDIPVDIEPFIGSGTEPVRVAAKVSGLLTGATYHYQVIATNSAGTTASSDQTFETLNSCGLPRQRCFELVSPRDPGPVAAPGRTPAATDFSFQAALNPGGLAYVVETGFPNSTNGGAVLYRGTREPAGWSSVQIGTPILATGETKTTNSQTSETLALSPDLSCGVQVSSQPLTSDATTRPIVEAGGSNLYRQNPDGSYVAISKLTPTDFENVAELLSAEYKLSGMSENCGKVVFGTSHAYPGVPGVREVVGGIPLGTFLYEWDEGDLRSVGSVPGPSGEEVMVPAIAGTNTNHSNVVSEDGSRVFFSAKRQSSPNPAEIGQNAVFLREGGITRDISLSETSTPDTGATYQYATADGSRIFFTANAGLTEESSVEGTDLYEYNLETEDLTNLSVESDPGGADVSGFIGASDDGTHVYFVARGQLVPGKGKTFAQNQSADTYSIYGAAGGQVEFAGTAAAGPNPDRVEDGLTLNVQEYMSSRVSRDGRYLLFETMANVTGYDSGGVGQVYLYSASDKSTTCVSCRPDGQPSLSSRPALNSGSTIANPLHQIANLVMVDSEPSVFFISRNQLAGGGAEGRYNLYEWSHGQVFTIDTEAPGLTVPAAPLPNLTFAGASADGSDLYLATANTLTWEDGDDRSSVYDARIGGGHPEPPPPPIPCEPTREGSCQGSSTPPPAILGTASATFRGSGNAKPGKAQKRHKKHHKKKKHQKNQSKQKSGANGNRRAGK